MKIELETLNKIKWYFERDDGSLPEINVANISNEQSEAIFLMLTGISEKFHDRVTVWDEELKDDIKCNSYENSSVLYRKIKANCSSVPLLGITINDVILPELGLFVFDNEIQLFYRMGREWNINTLSALLELFNEIKKIAPNAVFEMPKDGEAPYSPEMIDTFNDLLKLAIKTF